MYAFGSHSAEQTCTVTSFQQPFDSRISCRSSLYCRVLGQLQGRSGHSALDQKHNFLFEYIFHFALLPKNDCVQSHCVDALEEPCILWE
ncbi:hypothetical protein DPMN_063316 [Dreissena polymorpha]|uniref:Uncharacterized protein n=1 Tax=Dreissena polymorpha TaxID=45954 RepID=A0A9D4CAA3_DREPO|nr:hypothetical protein DPMN_063316 [Dreissena polymorpha]